MISRYMYTLQNRGPRSQPLAAPKENLPVIAAVGIDLQWSKSAYSTTQNHGFQQVSFFFFFRVTLHSEEEVV